MRLSRKNFIKLGLFGFFSHKLLAAEPKAKGKQLFLRGKTIILKKKETLVSNTSVIGPGKIIVDSLCDYIELRGSNITIRDIEFVVKGNTQKKSCLFKIQDGTEQVLIDNCSFLGGRYTVLKADENGKQDSSLKFKYRAKRVKITNNFFKGKYTHHLYLHSVEELIVRNNSFESSTRDSIRLRQNIKKAIIDGNFFKKIGVKSPDSSDALDTFWSGEELIISNNHIEDIQKYGLDIKGISPDRESSSSKVIIANNLIQSSGFSGILISSGTIRKKRNYVSDFIIHSNQIRGANLKKNLNEAGIFLRHGVKNVIISSNIIDMDDSHGIILGNFEEKAEQSQNILVNSNIIRGTGSKFYGILAYAIKDLKAEQNLIESSRVKFQKSFHSFKS